VPSWPTSALRVGRYGIEAANLARMVETELGQTTGNVDLYVVDEIGKIELLCPEFLQAVPRLLNSPVPVVALRGGGLVMEAKDRQDVRVVKVTDALPVELEAWVRGRVRSK